MGKYLDYKQDVLTDLKERFRRLNFECLIENIGIQMTCFFVIGNSDFIEEGNAWQKISESIALKYQSKISDPFDKWNIYIMYIFLNDATKELKNRIETDTFSSRKIVEDKFVEDFTVSAAKNFIIKHITNKDLKGLESITVDINRMHDSDEYAPLNEKLWASVPFENIKGNITNQKELLLSIENEIYRHEN
jgi:ribosomal protein S17E